MKQVAAMAAPQSEKPLDAVQLKRRQEEVASEQNAVGNKRQAAWKYLTQAEIEQNNPSIRDGLAPAKEAKWRREYTTVLQKAGMMLRM